MGQCAKRKIFHKSVIKMVRTGNVTQTLEIGKGGKGRRADSEKMTKGGKRKRERERERERAWWADHG